MEIYVLKLKKVSVGPVRKRNKEVADQNQICWVRLSASNDEWLLKEWIMGK